MSLWKILLITFGAGMAFEFLVAGPLERWRKRTLDRGPIDDEADVDPGETFETSADTQRPREDYTL